MDGEELRGSSGVAPPDPTTPFLGRDGRVRKIHSGFAGPGTGEHHTRMVAELETLIEELLAEPLPYGTTPTG